MKVRYHGVSDDWYFVDGEVYEVIGKQCGFWSIIDESGSDYLYGPNNCFEIVEGNPDELKEIPLSDFADRN